MHYAMQPSRSEWEFEKGAEVDVRRLMSGGSVNEEGYVNVARQLGISELRGTWYHIFIGLNRPCQQHQC